MKNYLSFGGGVNSVAMYLYMKDHGVDFTAIFVDHGTDWPETYRYVNKFKEKYPLTILKPDVESFDSLYDYCWNKNIIPSMMFRWCTDKFKIKVITKYVEKPCFMMLGIDYGESHRAKLNTNKGVENRFPLIESKIDRDGCKKIIREHGLPMPIKSGCYICSYQKTQQWIQMRTTFPELWCKADKLERKCNLRRRLDGKKNIYITGKMSISELVNERQSMIWQEDEYPPCECML